MIQQYKTTLNGNCTPTNGNMLIYIKLVHNAFRGWRLEKGDKVEPRLTETLLDNVSSYLTYQPSVIASLDRGPRKT